ncbi:hypothetical protein [Bacillus cereus]
MDNLETKSNVNTSPIIGGKLNRGLRPRHISMIAIGTGLFLLVRLL